MFMHLNNFKIIFFEALLLCERIDKLNTVQYFELSECLPLKKCNYGSDQDHFS
jgi:hypothetical protein